MDCDNLIQFLFNFPQGATFIYSGALSILYMSVFQPKQL